tara:strand:+ start:349 stop:1080 length:732 start_codon:yes stop_codon:yes gene_type:complete
MLYANGCSFTYGTGLALKDKAWPFMLAKKLGIKKKDVVTDAERGISNQYIVRHTITAVSELIANGKKPFVAIGLSAPNRREHFIEKDNILIHNIPSHEYHGNIRLDEKTNIDLDIFNTLYMKHFWSPVYDFHNYLIQVMSLQNFCVANDLEYILFNSLNLTPNLIEPTNFTKLCEQADMKDVLAQLNMDCIYEDQTFFTYMYDKSMFFPTEGDERYLHPNAEAHSDWADILFADVENTRGMKK